jgi:hypothetical protein
MNRHFEIHTKNHKRNKASCDTQTLPIERFKIMEKRKLIFLKNVLMTINLVMDGKFLYPCTYIFKELEVFVILFGLESIFCLNFAH